MDGAAAPCWYYAAYKIWEAALIRLLLAASLCLGGALLHADPATAQAYPDRPIKVIVPFPAGGPTDGMARIIADRLGTVLGQSIVIENKGGGAGGSIGAKFVAASDPDGYTILITPGGSLTTGPAVHKNIGYDPVKVFVPVAQLIETPLVVSVHPSLPVKTMAELVTYAKANPGKVSWGSQGFGVAPHLLIELFKLETGVNVVHVPYRGTAPMLSAVLAGEVQVVADPMTTSLVHIEADKLRAIAIAGAERTPKLPNVPTVVEAGFPKLQSPFWLGVVAPAGTPQPVIDKLNKAFRESMAPPETRALLAKLGADIKIGTPQAFGDMLAKELALWTGVVKDAKITVE
jgi:tripartite-type tricarboxylate transporter receptor subunit TctC